MTVPISSVDADNVESLCYEIHGEENAFFNLISDECTSVNSYYQRAVAPPSNLNLNVITQIGVRARGTNTCWNIQVDLDTCSAMVDGAPPTSGGSFDGITVRSYPSSSRVRISVPNCADSMLVMWVFCRDGQVEDPTTMEFNNFRFIRLVVRRGLNLNEQSHGLIGTKLYLFSYLLSPFLLFHFLFFLAIPFSNTLLCFTLFSYVLLHVYTALASMKC